MNKTIKNIIHIAGSQQKLADFCGVSQMTVSKWLNGGGINSRYIPLLVEASEGLYTSEELINELFNYKLQEGGRNGTQ
ncbi:YdaS family helix-turn-helix protein [Gallibacterium anatis]|uniref:YdaS family helix-turn-helix protein n=1 Tax=Gallibacterium anatis TaxID=750 RepID=UPI00266FA317|nr:YdaS family helix-turn-helix protein [Gallibacterium anatis]WKS98335.1 helix-turn-helix domain-containing protein [Gallibacterium anatis]